MKPLEDLLEIAKSAKERADNAHEHICKLAKDGAKSWRLSIPVQDDDSDVLLQAPLDLVPQLSDAVIDLITQLKDAQAEIDWRNDNYYKLDDVNCKLNERIVKLEQQLAEKDAALEFYADKENWDERWDCGGGDEDQEGDVNDLINRDDVEVETNENGSFFTYGGVRAREVLQKYKG